MSNRNYNIYNGGKVFTFENVKLECHSGALHVYAYTGSSNYYDYSPLLIIGLDNLIYAQRFETKETNEKNISKS